MARAVNSSKGKKVVFFLAQLNFWEGRYFHVQVYPVNKHSAVSFLFCLFLLHFNVYTVEKRSQENSIIFTSSVCFAHTLCMYICFIFEFIFIKYIPLQKEYFYFVQCPAPFPCPAWYTGSVSFCSCSGFSLGIRRNM